MVLFDYILPFYVKICPEIVPFTRQRQSQHSLTPYIFRYACRVIQAAYKPQIREGTEHTMINIYSVVHVQFRPVWGIKVLRLDGREITQ